MTWARAIATFGYVGLMRPASGTWGSAAAVPVGLALHLIGGPLLLILATIALYPVGLRAVASLTQGDADPDRSEIVIDEAVGQWIALWPVSLGAWMSGAPIGALWPGIVVAFFAFRAFDIFKPWPANRYDARKDAVGVMADDVFAGLYAALAVLVIAAIGHGLLLG
ncbi:MAG: phosphatidylglycerophosphatase A [Pseudomonadota bacterium]